MQRFGLMLAYIVTAVALSTSANADSRQTLDYFRHQVWSTEDGLPQASVHALLQSQDGYLWIATEDGAARFDGQSFRVLNSEIVPAFVSNDVSCLTEDQAGDIWFGTSDGLVRKHGEEYRHFSEPDGLPSEKIVALAASHSGLLVLTTGGLAAWQHDHFEPIAVSAPVTGLAGPQRGLILISTKDGVYRWDHGHLVAVLSAAKGASPVLGAALGGKEAIWTFGTNFVELSSPSQKTIWQSGRDLPGSRVQALYVDPQGKAWVGTNRGLASIDAATGFTVRDSEPLRGEAVLSVLGDREGDLWIGTEASGLHALLPRKFATAPGSNSEAVTTVARDSRGVMYFGTRDDGIFRAEEGAVRVVPGKLTSPVILSLAAGPDRDLWVGTPDGLNHIVGAEVHHWTIADGLPDNFVRSVVAVADGSVWAGTRFGLVHISGNAVHAFSTADGLPSDSIGPLLQVSSSQSGATALWIGTSAGLCRETTYHFHCLSSPYPANSSIITALAADRGGGLWVALHNHGLALVRGDRMVPVSASAVRVEIVGIISDNLGYLWLRSSPGLYRVAVSDLRACISNSSACGSMRIDSYGRGDGMQSDELAGEGVPLQAKGPNEELWFATRRGVAVTDPQHLLADLVPPGVVITQVHVDGVELPTNGAVEVDPGHRQYRFEYAGLSLNNAASSHCRYMLDGFDRGWVDAGTRRTAYYTNLPSRQYIFKAMCSNSDGVWSKEEARFQFRVLTPWYRSIWIYLLGFCLTTLAIFGFIQLSVRAERRRFDLVLQERSRVAREVHDTLAQDLVSVSLQVEMAAQHAKAGRLAEVTEQLTQTRGLVQQALDSARQSIWNLRANLSKESLPVRLAACVEGFHQTQGSARLRISGQYRSADPALENEVMRIATEVISNVERHSGATEMAVELSYGADNLRLQIRDNGCGFDYSSRRGLADHYGLRGLDERAALLEAQLTVESIAGQGTTVTLIAPLPTERSL